MRSSGTSRRTHLSVLFVLRCFSVSMVELSLSSLPPLVDSPLVDLPKDEIVTLPADSGTTVPLIGQGDNDPNTILM